MFGSIFSVKLLEDNHKTTVVEFKELIQNSTNDIIPIISETTIRYNMTNFTMKPGIFETVQFIQRNIIDSFL